MTMRSCSAPVLAAVDEIRRRGLTVRALYGLKGVAAYTILPPTIVSSDSMPPI